MLCLYFKRLSRFIRQVFFLTVITCCAMMAGIRTVAGALPADRRPAHVMILNSYHQGFKWTDEIVLAVMTIMSAELPDLEFHVEYMDSKRNQGEQFAEGFYQSLVLKYRNQQPDIIITTDDAALDFMQRHHQQLFPHVPVVFCGVNSVSKALSVDRNHFTGLIETLDIAENISLARYLLPALREIVVVTDGTPTGLGTRQMAKEAEQTHQDLAFVYLNGEELNTDEMLDRISRLPQTSAVIVPAWYLDRDGHVFDNRTIYPRIAKASSVPVFGTSSANLGLGIVGGKLNSGTIQGEYSARQALRILTDEAAINDMSVETTSQNKYMFDYQQLMRFQIAAGRLPPDAIVLNRPVPLYEQYRAETTFVVTTFLLLVIIITVLIWNIHRRRKVEQDLVMQKRLAEQYLAIAGVMLVALDDHGRVTLINRKGQDVLGYSERELLGVNWYEVCALPEETGTAYGSYLKVIAGARKPLEYNEGYVVTRSGEHRLIAWNNVLLRDNDDNVLGMLSSGEDITERRSMEEGLRESELRFRALHNASFGGIAIHDEGVILDCNQGLSDMTGYTFDELVGMDGLQLIAPAWRETVMQRILAGYEQPYEVEGIRKDGTVYPLHVYGKQIPYRGRTAQVVEFRDITSRKEAEQERNRLETQLQQARKIESIGQLAGGVAHDFNNMLSAILGHVEIAMLRSLPSEPVLAHLRAIDDAARRSADLVRQLLAFASKQTVTPRILDINEMSTTILRMLHRVIGEDIELSWSPGADLWQIRMDPSQLDQLLVNLCVNARDAIGGVGTIAIETKNVSVDENFCRVNRGGSPGEYVMLSVSDTGCGMSRDIQDQIFEPFFTTKEVGKGTGLGLSTVYGIIKQNDGFINLYSEPGKGTIFRLYLPRAIGENEIYHRDPEVETPKGSGESVLLVEDESVLREVARIMLEELGYEVLMASTPGEALELARQNVDTIQLLITDVVMPEMNGRVLAGLVGKIKPGVRCLYTSGYAANVIAHHGILEEHVCFLPKPFSMHDLAVQVQRALG